MNRRLIILGAGGHARVLLGALAAAGVRPAGCLAPELSAGWPAEVPRLGDDDHLLALDPVAVELINGVGGVGSTALRRAVFERAKAKGFAFSQVLHPSAVVTPDCLIGEGAQIMAGAIVQTGALLGDNTLINTGAVVDHDCRIGAHCHVAPGATLSGGVELGIGTHVGTGACIIQGVRLGEGVVVGAGAVVIRDVADGQTVVGNPARPIH